MPICETRIDRCIARCGKALVLTALVLLPAISLAHGPYYGSRLLENRERSLKSLWSGSFYTEAVKLVEPPDGIVYPDDGFESRERLEERLLTPAQRELIGRIRAESKLDATQTLAADLPAEVAAYVLGARAWYRNRHAEALEYFGRAAGQSAESGSPWPLMAQFMIGRTHARLVLEVDDPRGDPQLEAHGRAAFEAFEATRELARAGAADPLGLALASLGEQARLHKRFWQLEAATHLYARQAATGQRGGINSLLFLTRWARNERPALEAFLEFSLGRELIVLFANTHIGLSRMQESYVWQEPVDEDDPVTGGEVIARLLESLEALPPEELPLTDQLAALLYRSGRFEQAERTVALADSPLADWVRAKLALRNNQPEAAAEHFHQAIRGFRGEADWDEHHPVWESRRPGSRVAAEAGLLALTRNEVTRSLKLMLEAGAVYWLDAAYLADYVLTVDELVEVAETINWSDADRNRIMYWDGQRFERPSRRDRFETLVGRRLMRVGRYDEAVEIFPFEVQRQNARRYAALMREPADEPLRDKARRLFEAAVMTRRYGLNLLGYEAEPDFAHYGGNYHFEYGLGHALDDARREETAQWLAPRELEWIRAGKIRLLSRYTYRFTAAELAGQAADHLPAESEAFAAVLCHASKWLLTRYPEAGREYYYRYRREGRAVDWHEDFGQRCPAADFDSV